MPPNLGRYTSSPMKHPPLFSTFCCVFLSLLLTACGQKPVPLMEGVITKVVWAPDANGKTGLYRERMPEKLQPGQAGGSYSVDMSGLLYPSHLEVRFNGSRDSHSRIIPFNQIVWLEFGDGGIAVSKQ